MQHTELDQHRFEEFADAIPHMIWLADRTGAAVYHSRPFLEYTGGPAAAALGAEWHGLVHPDDLGAVTIAWAAAVRSGAPFACEHRIRRHDGAYRWHLGRAVVHEPADRAPLWFGTLTDIDDHKRAVEELRLRDRAIQAVPVGIVITDATRPDLPMVFASQGFELMTGYTAAEALGQNCRFLQGKDTDRGTVARVRAAVRAGEACVVELLNYTKAGAPFWNQLSISPVRDEAGRTTHFVGVQTDVTARRLLEGQLRQSQKMESLGQLAGGIAHDFNNLLTVINGYSKLLIEAGPGDPTWRESVSEIYHAGCRAADLTNQLLGFSRQTVLEPRVFDPNALIAGAEKLLRRLIGEDITLAARLAPSACCVRADPGQLEQALVNLAVNARDAMPQGGELTIGTRCVNVEGERPGGVPGPHVVIAVADTGHGMDPATRARIFEPFFTTKGPGKGTGLGLAMVYGFVRQSGGFVEVSSEPGRGTRFELFLPQVKAADAAGPITHPVSRATGRETVLLIEDDPSVRAFAGHVLRDLGYTVLDVPNDDEAARAAVTTHRPIALVVTDVVMPGMAGNQAVEAVRTVHPEARVLYMSGYTDDAVVRHGLAAGQMNFLQKPFTPASLARKVRDVLDG